jgi:excisionase family DNA binding protein
MSSAKVQKAHLERLALIYVRQSTFVQVIKNRESGLRQYDLALQARELGWREDQVVVIDEDQGHSGASTHDRSGFGRIMSEVGLGKVGIVLAIEASRLARNNADWQRLIWFCSLTDTLLGDQDGIYDPSLLDDRMVLGLKGTISELEWHTIRKRLHQAAVNKAKRGELEVTPPVGLEWQGEDGLHVTADQEVVHALGLVFDKFDELGSARQAALWLRDKGIKLPRRGPRGEVRWIESNSSAVGAILTHPAYAGAYVYGRERKVRKIEADGSVVVHTRKARTDEVILLRDHHEGLISWERFERIQERLMANYTKGGIDHRGAAREGAALLQGLAYCGRCGRRMTVAYLREPNRGFGQFVCRWLWRQWGTDSFCQVLGGRRIEEAVVSLFLNTVQPAAIEVALKSLEGVKQERDKIAQHWQQRTERAEYDADRARARYEAIDPNNRLVASELERRWNEALALVDGVRREAEEHLQRVGRDLCDAERARIRRMAEDVGRIWAAPTTGMRDKKQLLRAAIERVVLTRQQDDVTVAVHWKGGEVSQFGVHQPRRGENRCATDAEILDLIRRLATDLDDTQIARVLCRRGLRTATGLTFTKRRVQSVRACHNIPCAPRAPAGEDVYTAEEAAREMGVSGKTIHEWIRAGLLRGKQLTEGAPWRIVLDEQTRRRLNGSEAPPGWVGIEEAARRLGVSKQTVVTWVKQGKFQAMRATVGRRPGWKIQVESVDSGKQRSLF